MTKGKNELCDEAIGLLVTYRCNLNCKYCYVHSKKPKEMTLEMAQSILEPFLMKQGGFLDIKFYGGETLMSFTLIKQLVEWVESKTWNRKYRFFGSTNGTLLNNEMKEWFMDHSKLVTMGLSFDGLPDVQLENRGSINIDIDYFISTWPQQTIQMTINTSSVNRMAEGIIYLLEKGAKVHPNVAFEEYEWEDKYILEYCKQLDILADYYSKHEKAPIIIQFEHKLEEYARSLDNHHPQVQVCGAGHGFRVYDVDGSKYPCHLLSPLVLETNQLNMVNKGEIEQAKDFADSKCANCPYTSSCPTCLGCNLIYRNDIRNRDLTHCKIMRAEVRAFIKKEVTRLKKKEVLDSFDAARIAAIRKIYDYEKCHSLL